ncbi:MAG: hypothetical protein L0387_44410 [Acidobacteria bacterium]|nr:hypothetical protein [Acidobacteriota bacterium]MCI0723011.1 hypothetical protein [Acidobacteriota bacterium]
MSRQVDIDQTAATMADLRQKIEYHNYRYHVLNSPELPDVEYDCLTVGPLINAGSASAPGDWTFFPVFRTAFRLL